MYNVAIIGKMNNVLEDLGKFLKRYFVIQVVPLNKETIKSALVIMKPSLIVVSLVGADETHSDIFSMLQLNYSSLPVITLGTENEMHHFLKYYESSQFINLIRPVDNLIVQDRIIDTLHLHPEDLVDLQIDQVGKKRIIVVDDNPTSLRSVKGMLEEEFEVILVNSGVKAMTAIGKKRPDLILLDYEMPVCDGKQTLEMLRADPTLYSIPVIFLTGIADKEHVNAIITLKPQGYLLKPPIKEALIHTIHRVLK